MTTTYPVAEQRYDQMEEAARYEVMRLIGENPGPCGKRLLFEKGDTSWVDTLAEVHRRLAEKQASLHPRLVNR